MRELALVATGGAIGAGLRYIVGGFVTSRAGTGFPWGTLAVNIVGAFLLGLLMALSSERAVLSAAWRVFLGIGLLGGFTTFSTLSFESVRLLEQGAMVPAAVNMFGSAVLGIIAAIAGLALGRAL
ncbi:MAG: fluoride efflux transporter CrcB [Coriobacteriia bacterium]|nr:fluoride efflux transporter CrcB [Coriobacteriia bacterium]MBN2822545.1 fluoride efflux transporter CrcB [Coriobacteriia bacterium]